MKAKRFLTLFLSALLCVSLLPVSALADEAGSAAEPDNGGSNTDVNGGDNGGEAPATQGWYISGYSDEHGSVTVVRGEGFRATGETVMLQVKPNSGWELDNIRVNARATYVSGNSIWPEKSDSDDSLYTFTVPKPDTDYPDNTTLYVQATFKALAVGGDNGGAAPATVAEPAPATEPVYDDDDGDDDDGDRAAPLTDVAKGAWYYDAVYDCYDAGIMEGVDDGLFDPDGETSRAMVVTMLWRLAGEPTVNYAMTFEDVSAGEWYTEAVRWAVSTGVVDGYDAETFGPSDSVTREQLAAILYRYAQTKGEGFKGMWYFLLDYPDAADVSDWADEAMHWMVMNEIITGTTDANGETVLDPQGTATRAQVAAITTRFCEIVK